jgi:dTDP-4-dehydrorhamnose reductase
VRGISTAEYFKDKTAAPRPLNSTLDLSKIASQGFTARDSREALKEYIHELRQLGER